MHRVLAEYNIFSIPKSYFKISQQKSTHSLEMQISELDLSWKIKKDLEVES